MRFALAQCPVQQTAPSWTDARYQLDGRMNLERDMAGARDRKSPTLHAIIGRESGKLLTETVAGLHGHERREWLALEMPRLATQHGGRFGVRFDDGSVNVREQP